MCEKSQLIDDYIKLKGEYQTLYFNYQESLNQIESLKKKLVFWSRKLKIKSVIVKTTALFVKTDDCIRLSSNHEIQL